MKKPIEQRVQVLQALLNKELTIQQAGAFLVCSTRSMKRYKKAFLQQGRDGLVDHRHSNNHVLTEQQKQNIIALKKHERWRSPRNIRDELHVPVHETTVWRVFTKHGLHRENRQQVKPIQRFEAKHPNDLWQTDIMGKITFPHVGDLYLIATLDDHSRFCLSGRWFAKQSKMNVFTIWYEALAHWGLPHAMLQDRGTQFKAHTQIGQADYEWYAMALKISLIFANHPRTKGKIERFWRFVQDDFVRSVWEAKTKEEVNGAFRVWIARYNYRFRSRYYAGTTHAERYHPSKRRVSRVELETLLLVEERRKVTRESTISLYGRRYYIPPGYIGCRIWVKIIGNNVLFEAAGRVFWKTQLKLY